MNKNLNSAKRKYTYNRVNHYRDQDWDQKARFLDSKYLIGCAYVEREAINNMTLAEMKKELKNTRKGRENDYWERRDRVYAKELGINLKNKESLSAEQFEMADKLFYDRKVKSVIDKLDANAQEIRDKNAKPKLSKLEKAAGVSQKDRNEMMKSDPKTKHDDEWKEWLEYRIAENYYYETIDSDSKITWDQYKKKLGLKKGDIGI